MTTRLEALRKEKSLTQEDLARMSGVRRVTISYLENGRTRPHKATLKKLAGALGVSWEELGIEDLYEHKRGSKFVLRTEAPQAETVEDLVHAVEEGVLSAAEAMDVLRDAGILQPRAKLEVTA